MMLLRIPIDYIMDIRRNRFLWRRRTRVWRFATALASGRAGEMLLAVPFLLLAPIAIVELIAEIVLWPIAALARVIRVRGHYLVIEESYRRDDVEYQRRRITLRLPAGKAVKRLRTQLITHVRQGGRAGDPIVGQWLATEQGRVV